MGVPNMFNDIIQKHLNVFAAWVPIVNQFNLGDYGIFADGVFSKLGNITEDYKVTFKEGVGSEADIDFTSEGASVVKLGGSATVDVAAAGQVKAGLQITFSKEKSFLVKSPKITVKTIENVNAVSKLLKATGAWDGQWKVVHQVYNAIDAIIVSTIEKGTKLDFTGEASLIGDMKLGGVGVNIDTNKALGLKINGKNGVIGLGLFRIKSKIFGGSKVLIMGDGDRGDEDMPIFLDPQETPEDDV